MGACFLVLLCWVLVVAAGCPQVRPIQESRIPERLPDGRWAVTDGWMQERMELERGLRWHLERCMEQEDENAQRPATRPRYPALPLPLDLPVESLGVERPVESLGAERLVHP